MNLQCAQLQGTQLVVFIHHWHMYRHFKSYFLAYHLLLLRPSLRLLAVLWFFFPLWETEFPKSDGGFLKKAYAFTTTLLSDALSTRWGSDSRDLTRTTRGDPCIDTGTDSGGAPRDGFTLDTPLARIS